MTVKMIKPKGGLKRTSRKLKINEAVDGGSEIQDLLAKMSEGGATSVRRLARAAGLHANGIQNLKSGKTKDIKLTTLVKLAGAVGFTVELVKGKTRIPVLAKTAALPSRRKSITTKPSRMAMTKEGKLDTNLIHRRPLFWDIAEKRIPQALIENDDWVIVRIFEYGDIADIYDVIHLYGREKCSEVLSHEKLKPMADAMAYVFLKVDRYGNYGS